MPHKSCGLKLWEPLQLLWIALTCSFHHVIWKKIIWIKLQLFLSKSSKGGSYFWLMYMYTSIICIIIISNVWTYIAVTQPRHFLYCHCQIQRVCLETYWHLMTFIFMCDIIWQRVWEVKLSLLHIIDSIVVFCYSGIFVRFNKVLGNECDWFV